MPPSDIQARVLKIISANRSPDSHIGGGIALNYEGPRLSFDIAIFHDQKEQVARAADADAQVLISAGFEVERLETYPSMIKARVRVGDQQTSIDWVQDSAFRFFPIQTHPDLG